MHIFRHRVNGSATRINQAGDKNGRLPVINPAGNDSLSNYPGVYFMNALREVIF